MLHMLRDSTSPEDETPNDSSIIPAAFHAQLTDKQRGFLEALLAGPNVTITQAAETVGVTRKTAHIWLHQPAVAQALKAARQSMFDESLFLLQQSGIYAVNTLLRNLKSDVPASAQVRAAEVLLDFKLKFEQVEILSDRVSELEAMLGPKPLRGHGWPA